MNVLFLDDDPERQKAFRSGWPSAVIVSTSAEAIAALAKQAWDVVFLDHDLGGEIFVDSSREDTGMEVVRWVLANKPKVDKFVVHSLNSGGAENMDSSLSGAHFNSCVIPFTAFDAADVYGTLEKISVKRGKESAVRVLLKESHDFHAHAIDQGWHNCDGIPGGCTLESAIKNAKLACKLPESAQHNGD